VVVGTAVSLSGGGSGAQTTPASTAACPAGKVLLGGGATTTGSAAVSQSRPNGSTWEANAIRVTGNAVITVTAYAVCTA
jgi:hypothetical protein